VGGVANYKNQHFSQKGALFTKINFRLKRRKTVRETPILGALEGWHPQSELTFEVKPGSNTKDWSVESLKK
jgi:hypothetical protein